MDDVCQDAGMDHLDELPWEVWVAELEALPLEDILEEREACRDDPAYFLNHYVWIKDDQNWIRFVLWLFQIELIDKALASKLLVLLKARQLGCSWVFLGLILWGMIFEPGSLALLFSLKQSEAQKLLRKLKDMYFRLPRWLQADGEVITNETHWKLTNGSEVEAYGAKGGDSNNARRVLVDEADLIPNLPELLDSLKPTINDGSSHLWMISRSLKKRPNSSFKRIYRESKSGSSILPWSHVFYPWHVRPDRDEAWYQQQVASSLAEGGSLDSVHGNYPATDAEALAPKTLGKRLAATHLLPCYLEQKPIPDNKLPKDAPAIPQMRVYVLPVPGRKYRIGADPAGGLLGPENDDSAFSVVDLETGEECAVGSDRWEPTEDFPEILHQVAVWYGDAAVLYERNNHGAALKVPLQKKEVTILDGPDGNPGYNKNEPSKKQLWISCWGVIKDRARTIREEEEPGQTPRLIHDFKTYTQLSSLEAESCKAPPGDHDDDADAWGLAQYARGLAEPEWEEWDW